jgi:hypothetical protein
MEDSFLLGYDATSVGNKIPTFRANVVSYFQGAKCARKIHISDAASHSSRTKSSATPLQKFRSLKENVGLW